MIFIVDAQLPPALAIWLQGHEGSAVRDIGLRDATDGAIWRRAFEADAIIVTKDEDFVRLASTDSQGPRVLWVRTGNVLNRVLLTRFEAAWTDLRTHLLSSARVIEIR